MSTTRASPLSQFAMLVTWCVLCPSHTSTCCLPSATWWFLAGSESQQSATDTCSCLAVYCLPWRCSWRFLAIYMLPVDRRRLLLTCENRLNVSIDLIEMTAACRVSLSCVPLKCPVNSRFLCRNRAKCLGLFDIVCVCCRYRTRNLKGLLSSSRSGWLRDQMSQPALTASFPDAHCWGPCLHIP